MLFADDLVLCEDTTTREAVEVQLETWRDAMETPWRVREYCKYCSEVDRVSTTTYIHEEHEVRLGEETPKLWKVKALEYLGTIIDAKGGSTADCRNRVRLTWNKWKEVIAVICDKNW